MKRSMSMIHFLGALAIGILSLSAGTAFADPCQDCAGAKIEDAKLHGRSIKSYWANKGTPPDTVVLKKGLEQGHLALCGNPTQWDWSMYSGMFAIELANATLASSTAPGSKPDPEREKALQAEALRLHRVGGCYFKNAISNASNKKDIEMASNNRDSYWVARYNSALTFFQRKSYEDALEELDYAIALSPDSCRSYTLKGTTLLQMGKTEEALKVYSTARALCPSDTMLTGNEFKASFSEGNRHFALAQKAKGDSARVHYTDAIAWYEKAIKVQPNDANTLYQLGTAQMYLVLAGDSTQVDAARKNLAAFLPQAPSRQDSLAALYNLVVLESEGNNPTKAGEYADLYLKLDPRDADGYRLKAKVLSQQGTPQQAESYIIFFNAMSKGQPVESWDTHFASGKYASTDLAKAVQERGNPEEARTYKDSSGNPMDALFYWTKGEGMAFYAGSQRGQVTFPAQPKK
jgi:tetratricopeptide (TPR) repeat protein